MHVSYKRLWMLLIYRDMKKKDLMVYPSTKDSCKM